MSKIDKDYFKTLKGDKVVFKIVKMRPDIKVKFVDVMPDYRIEMVNKKAFAKETIRVEVVEMFPDVRLKKVDHFADFKVCID